MIIPSVKLIVGVFVFCNLVAATFTTESNDTSRTTYVSIYEVPYHASIWFLKDYMCNGAIIGIDAILTTASCVMGFTPEYYSEVEVRTGSTNINRGHKHKIAAIHRHPNFTFTTFGIYDNDLAVIKLTKPIEKTLGERLIQLAKKEPPVGSTAIVTGWGLNYLQDEPVRTLRKVESTIISKSECQSKLHAPLRPNTMCTSDSGDRNICAAGSGSPLVRNNELGGLMSWKDNCGKKSVGVYVSVAPHLIFIKQAMFGESKSL